jgi:hypothetical protein
MASSSKVTLKPSAGYCIKTMVVQPGFFTPAAPLPDAASSSNVLSPTRLSPSQIPVPQGLKVFVNIAWDKNVPPPPEGNEDVIQRAMQGEDVDEANPDGWYVPVIVSQGREDKDKGERFYCHVVARHFIYLDAFTQPENRRWYLTRFTTHLSSLARSRTLRSKHSSLVRFFHSTCLILLFLIHNSPQNSPYNE